MEVEVHFRRDSTGFGRRLGIHGTTAMVQGTGCRVLLCVRTCWRLRLCGKVFQLNKGKEGKEGRNYYN